MRYKFIHLGMPKCGSTFLQGLWGSHPPLAMINLAEAIAKLRARPLAETVGQVAVPEISAGQLAGRAPCASNEGFLFAYLNQPDRFGQITAYFESAAAWVAANRLTEDVLIVVRDPISWLRSIHEQAVKEGGSQSAEDFLASHDSFLRQHLDLAQILKIWDNAGLRGHVLPLEALRDREDWFFRRIEERIGVPVPDRRTRQTMAARSRAVNASLGDRLIGLAAMNRRTARVQETIATSKRYQEDLAAEVPSLPTMRTYQVFANRRFAEYAEEPVFWDLVGVPKKGAGDFRDFTVPPSLAEHIRAAFIAPLSGLEGFGSDLLDRYDRALAKATG